MEEYYKKLKDFVEKENIYNDIYITIKFYKKDLGPSYTISSISYDNIEDYELRLKVDELNNDILERESYAHNTNIFYLLKELITYTQGNQRNDKYYNPYKYYRGQSQNWKTIPSLLRDMSNEDGIEYYTDFEKIYEKISKEFPEDIKYYSIDDEQEKRFEVLSRLQHYELKTNLLDITENPFIALLFMTSSSLFYKPQLELYRIKQGDKFFQDGIKTFTNKRIKAQKGAFINYEKLYNCYDKNTSTFTIDKNDKIDRVIVSIEFDKVLTLESWKNIVRALKNIPTLVAIDNTHIVSDNLEKEIGNEYSESIKKLDKNDTLFTSNMYIDVITDIKNKLNEYGYYYDELFPDLPDYIKNISKKYT